MNAIELDHPNRTASGNIGRNKERSRAHSDILVQDQLGIQGEGPPAHSLRKGNQSARRNQIKRLAQGHSGTGICHFIEMSRNDHLTLILHRTNIDCGRPVPVSVNKARKPALIGERAIERRQSLINRRTSGQRHEAFGMASMSREGSQHRIHSQHIGGRIKLRGRLITKIRAYRVEIPGSRKEARASETEDIFLGINIRSITDRQQTLRFIQMKGVHTKFHFAPDLHLQNRTSHILGNCRNFQTQVRGGHSHDRLQGRFVF